MNPRVLIILIFFLLIGAISSAPFRICVEIDIEPESSNTTTTSVAPTTTTIVPTTTTVVIPEPTNATVVISGSKPLAVNVTVNSEETGYLRVSEKLDKIAMKYIKTAPKFNCTLGTICKLKVYHESYESNPLPGLPGTKHIFERELHGVLMSERNVILKVTVPVPGIDKPLFKYIIGNITTLPSPNHYFLMEMKTPNCKGFVLTPKGTVKFLEKLTNALDVPRSGITLHQMKCSENITSIQFSNNKIATEACNKKETRDFAAKMINDKGEISKTFLEKMKPFNKISNVNFYFSGWCGPLNVTFMVLLVSTIVIVTSIALYSIYHSISFTWYRIK